MARWKGLEPPAGGLEDQMPQLANLHDPAAQTRRKPRSSK